MIVAFTYNSHKEYPMTIVVCVPKLFLGVRGLKKPLFSIQYKAVFYQYLRDLGSYNVASSSNQ